VVQVEGIEPTRGPGPLRVALYGAPEGFPRDPGTAARTDTVAVAGTEAVHTFAEVAEGVWAVSVLHDADADGEMATDWLGRPKEGWGVSNDATGTFGPPSFEDAAVEARGDTTTVRIHLRY
jgi:uncharacterized protein (DUF2141 family)